MHAIPAQQQLGPDLGGRHVAELIQHQQVEATFRLYGDLTIRDVTRPVVLDAEYLGQSLAPWGQKRIGFDARTEIDREDWGVTWNMALESGGWVVSKGVQLEIAVEALKAEEEQASDKD